MKLINKNPFRIAGVLANATEREFQKQKAKIKAFTKVGKKITSDFDFDILDDIDRTEESVNKAFSSIEQNQDRVNYALFWFLNANPYDNTAIEYLKNGNSKKAAEIWEKVTIGKEVNSKNFSCFSNLGTYNLLSHFEPDIQQGIKAKIKLIESGAFEDFVHSVADKTYKIDNQKQVEKFIDDLLTELKSNYSNKEILQLFNACNEKTQQYLTKKLTEAPYYNIEKQIESIKKKRKANKSQAYKYGVSLYKDTKDDLSLLKSMLGTSNLRYKAIADQLANEIMQCGIDYFNDSKEIKSISSHSLKLLKLSKCIAVSSLLIDRANSNIESIIEIKIYKKIKSIEKFDFETEKKLLIVNCLLQLNKNSNHNLIIREIISMFITAINERISKITYDYEFKYFLKDYIFETIEFFYILKEFNSNYKDKLEEEINSLELIIAQYNAKLASDLTSIMYSKKEYIELERNYMSINELKKHLEKIEENGLLLRYAKIKDSISNIEHSYKKKLEKEKEKLSNIESWHLFRPKTVREKQISNQKKVIEELEKEIKNISEHPEIKKLNIEKENILNKLEKKYTKTEIEIISLKMHVESRFAPIRDIRL